MEATLPVEENPSPQFRGFLFGTPDTETNLQFSKIVNPNLDPPKGWGAIITPDEMRMIYFMGNSRLVTQDGTYLSDEALKGWIDQTANAISEELKWDIYPVLWRHRPARPNEPREIEAYARWDDTYRYKRGKRHFHFVKLRRRPIMRVEKWLLNNPYADTEILDLLPGAEINYEGGTLTNLRWGGYQQYQTGTSRHPSLPLRASRLHIYYDDLANSYLIDYATGYDNASRVPDDLKELVAKVLAIKIMSAYGDGIVSGLASFSIGVGVLHESVNTTMSATSAFFGARIKQFQEEIKDWMQRHKNRYSHPGITHL